MANDNTIHPFTAADIERYHTGQLTSSQMHDLEKAALDDPFLADALEGYAVPGVHVKADLADLSNRLAERTGSAKVVALPSAPRTSYRALRVAALFLFIAGASVLIYQFGFRNKNNTEIAQQAPQSKETIAPGGVPERADSVVPNNVVSTPTGNANQPGENKQQPATTADQPRTREEIKPVTSQETSETAVVPGKNTDDQTIARSTTTDAKNIPAAPVRAQSDKSDLAKTPEKKTIKEGDRTDNKLNNQAEELATATAKEKEMQQVNARKAAGITQKNEAYRNNINTFRGRVVDAENNGVPFANVTNVQDNNAGTYTDARGYFNLTYPDSVMNVQVRSIGFENNSVQLRNAVTNNQVVMQEDRKSLTEVVLSNQRSNSNIPRSRDNNLKVEEPEPVDGWVYYDAYLANNIEVPEDLRSKPSSTTGEVQVSFEVDKNGEPTAFKIEKSLCGKCDKEAIRLIKEGPKWRRNANKNGRTTVTITF